MNGGSYYNGSLDNLLVFNRSLSNEEIQALYLGEYNKIVRQELSKGEIWKVCVQDYGRKSCSNNLIIAS